MQEKRNREVGSEMVVEVFFKGSYFKKLFDTFWNIKEIKQSGHNFILKKETDEETKFIYLDTETYELRICY